MDALNPGRARMRLVVWGENDAHADAAQRYAESRPSARYWIVEDVRRLSGGKCPVDSLDPKAAATEAGFGWAYAYYPEEVEGMAELYKVMGDGEPYYLTRTEAETQFLDRRVGGESGLEGDLASGFSYPLRDRLSGREVGTVHVLPSSAEELQADATGTVRLDP